MRTKGVGILLVIISAVMILPITSQFIYEKIKIPRTLKIILPIVFIIIALCLNGSNKLTCKLDISNDVGTTRNEIVYTFNSDGSIKSINGNQYARPTNSTIAEYLWSVTNKQQDQYNHYDGLTYNATYSENNEIVLTYSIDAKKAPTMFNIVATLSGVKGITINSTKAEIEDIFKQHDYTCN